MKRSTAGLARFRPASLSCPFIIPPFPYNRRHLQYRLSSYDAKEQSQEEFNFPGYRRVDLKKTSETSPSKGFESPGNLVSLAIDDKPFAFSPVLLRDICECPACVDASTKQKLFSTPEIPLDISAREVTSTDSGFSIKWDQDVPGYDTDHTTWLNRSLLYQIQRSGSVEPAFSPGTQPTWRTEQFQKLEDIDYEAYMQDDAILYEALKQLHTHGLLFLSNVPEVENSVSTIGERIGPIKNTFYGYTWDVRSVPEAKNVAYTSQNLGFHMDLLYMEQPPHIQLLHCIRSSARGGASQFTDSLRAVRNLLYRDLQTFITLATTDVTFHYNHPTTNPYRQQRPVIELDPLTANGEASPSIKGFLYRLGLTKAYNREPIERLRGRIKNISWSPPFQGPFRLTDHDSRELGPGASSMASLNRKVEEWHVAARKFNTIIHQPHGVYERMMRPGECVIFDNRRVLHGRKEFEVGDAGSERWLRGAYLDKDPYMSKFEVLSRRFGS